MNKYAKLFIMLLVHSDLDWRIKQVLLSPFLQRMN